MDNVITSGTTLRVPNFQNNTTCVHVFGHVCIIAPSNSTWNIEESSKNKAGGHEIDLNTNSFIYIGSPAGRFQITAQKTTKLTITSGMEARILSDEFMLAVNDIKTDAHRQYRALCLAYLDGKTVGDIAKRPDAIFSTADPKKRDAAINAMKEHGFYNCLKIMRTLV